jgi:hypothetical protein
VTGEDLETELLRRMELDQAARQQVVGHSDDPRAAQWAAVGEVDHDNTAWLVNVVERGGWPRSSEVGEDAATAAWLLAQHADDSPDIQHTFHLHMTAAVASGEADAKLLAYLEDRVRVNAGQPQLFGTQFISDETGALRPQPIQNPDSLDQRRAAIGLEPFAKYESTMHATWTNQSPS